MKKLFTLALCSFVLCAGAALVKNGDFKDGYEGWQTSPTPNGKKITLQKDADGKRYVSLFSPDKSGQTDITYKFPAAEIAGKEFILRARIKVENVERGAKNYHQARLLVTCRNNIGREREISGAEYRTAGTSDWQTVSIPLAVPQDATREVKLYAGLHNASGTLKLTDLELIPADSAAALLDNGDFSKGLAGWKYPAGAVKLKKSPFGFTYAEISSDNEKKQTYLEKALPVALLRGKTVLVAFKFKVDDVKKQKYRYQNGRVGVSYRDSKRKEHEPFRCTYERTGTSEWEQAIRICKIPADATAAQIFIGLHTTSGKVSVADIKIIPPQEYKVREILPGLTEYIYDGQHIYDRDKSARGPVFHYMEKRLLRSAVKRVFSPDSTARARGFETFITAHPMEINHLWKPAANETAARKIKMQVTPDQGSETVFLAVMPYSDVSDFSVTSTAPAEIRYGKNELHRVGYLAWDMLVHFSPKILYNDTPGKLAVNQGQVVALTFKVPENASGVIKSEVTVRGNGNEQRIPVEMEVLPFTLPESKPFLCFYYGHNPAKARSDFAEMRQYGITSAILAQCEERPKLIDGKISITIDESAAMVDEWVNAGFKAPLIWNPFHDRLLSLLIDLHGAGAGLKHRQEYGQKVYIDFKAAEIPQVVKDSYKETIRKILAEAKKHNFPEFVYFAVDEPGDMDGNHNWRTEAAMLEYGLVKEVAPEVKTFCTDYFPKTVRILEKEEDYTCIPLYFMGNSKAFEKFKMQGFQEYYQKQLKRQYWGIEWPSMWNGYLRARFTAGFYPAKQGLDGMTIWTYYSPRQREHVYEELIDKRKLCNSAFLDEQNRFSPTLQLLGTRDGIIDWRYAGKLEELLAAMPDSAEKQVISGKYRELLDKVNMEWISGYSLEAEPEDYFIGNPETPGKFRAELIKLILQAMK